MKEDAKYFYQIQMQMFVLGLKSCDFVIWTKKGIKNIEIPYNSTFMEIVCAKLEKFWTSQVVPLMMPAVTDCPDQGNYNYNLTPQVVLCTSYFVIALSNAR